MKIFYKNRLKRTLIWNIFFLVEMYLVSPCYQFGFPDTEEKKTLSFHERKWSLKIFRDPHPIHMSSMWPRHRQVIPSRMVSPSIMLNWEYHYLFFKWRKSEIYCLDIIWIHPWTLLIFNDVRAMMYVIVSHTTCMFPGNAVIEALREAYTLFFVTTKWWKENTWVWCGLLKFYVNQLSWHLIVSCLIL